MTLIIIVEMFGIIKLNMPKHFHWCFNFLSTVKINGQIKVSFYQPKSQFDFVYIDVIDTVRPLN